VKVLEPEARAPANCTHVGTVKGRDGYTGDPWHFKDGTRARALEQLRKSAAAKGGTAVLIRDERVQLCLHCSGSVVEIVADVLKCG
jgi:hypothetical protein